MWYIYVLMHLHVHTWTQVHAYTHKESKGLICASIYYLASLTSKDSYLTDLKKLKRKVGSAQFQHLFLKRLTNIHRGLSLQTHCQRVAADYCTDWGGDSSSLDLQRGEACEGHRVELCLLRHQRVLEAEAPSLCHPPPHAFLNRSVWVRRKSIWMIKITFPHRQFKN